MPPSPPVHLLAPAAMTCAARGSRHCHRRGPFEGIQRLQDARLGLPQLMDKPIGHPLSLPRVMLRVFMATIGQRPALPGPVRRFVMAEPQLWS